MLHAMLRPRLLRWLASSAFALSALCVSGCAPDDERERIVTELPRVAKQGPAVPIAVEVISMDETEPYDAPKVGRIR